MKVLDAEIATTMAAMMGFEPMLAAMFIASGIMRTVAPTFEATSEIKGVRIEITLNFESNEGLGRNSHL